MEAGGPDPVPRPGPRPAARGLGSGAGSRAGSGVLIRSRVPGRDPGSGAGPGIRSRVPGREWGAGSRRQRLRLPSPPRPLPLSDSSSPGRPPPGRHAIGPDTTGPALTWRPPYPFCAYPGPRRGAPGRPGRLRRQRCASDIPGRLGRSRAGRAEPPGVRRSASLVAGRRERVQDGGAGVAVPAATGSRRFA